jgi:hypothetical protein
MTADARPALLIYGGDATDKIALSHIEILCLGSGKVCVQVLSKTVTHGPCDKAYVTIMRPGRTWEFSAIVNADLECWCDDQLRTILYENVKLNFPGLKLEYGNWREAKRRWKGGKSCKHGR